MVDSHPDEPSRKPAKVSARAIAALAFAAVCVYALDQVLKALVVAHLPYGETVRVLGPVLQLHYVRNPGAAFSFATGQTWIFTIVAAIVVGVIVVTARRIRSLWWAVLFGMLLGGALGNLTDRLTREPGFGRGEVVDFIYTPWMMPAIYNVADSFICISMVLFVLLTLLGVNLDGSRSAPRKPRASGDADAPDAGGPPPASGEPEPIPGHSPGGAQSVDGTVRNGAVLDRDETLGHDAT